MSIYAIGDLHLSNCADKPMDVFGSVWDNHQERISDAWQSIVKASDIVLLPGDLSWAMRLEDAVPDIDFVGRLNGRKVIIRGNHDYWWNSISKVRSVIPGGMYALQNDFVELDGLVIAGTRGWTCPGSAAFKPEDGKIYEREVLRLSLSLGKVDRTKPLVCMLHYPPFNEKRKPSGFTELFEKYGAQHTVYGHLHDKACKNAFEGERGGVMYTLVSADHVDFAPVFIM